MAQMMKQECDKEAGESQLTDAVMSNQASATLSAQAYQQVLQQTSGAGNLTPQLQFFQAPSNSAAASLSLPWMMPHYQMMVLPQGVQQSLFAASNVLTLQDSHILVAPLGDGNNGQPADDSLIQAATAEGLVRQVKDSDRRPGASPAQPRPSATTGVAGDGRGSAVHGGNMMTVGQQVIADGTAFNAHLANTSVENILGRHRQVQGEIAKPDVPKPPKKPLTPYMLFSKAIWPQVKAANSHLSSVCEIGAVVGALWRELDPNEKQRYNEQFTKDKERYDTELRLYLSTTGLHASDLVKPKQKRKDIRDKTARPTPSTTLNTPGQHLVQSMMGASATGLDQRQTATAAAAAALPNLGQDWTGQVQQFANQQQLLAQMGLAGQTVYANSDGSISVDSGLGGLVAFHPQLQVVPGTSGTVVSGAGGQIATIYSDQRHGGLAQSSASKLDAATSLSEDPSRAWPQSQPNLVLYQATAAASADQVKTESQRSQQAALKAVGGKAAGDGAMNGPMSQDHPDQQYYSLDQIVKCEDDVGRKGQLENELLHLRSALSEKNNEVQSLNLKLEEAYRVIERYKQQFSELALSQPAAAAGAANDGVATDSATAATVATTVNSTSG